MPSKVRWLEAFIGVVNRQLLSGQVGPSTTKSDCGWRRTLLTLNRKSVQILSDGSPRIESSRCSSVFAPEFSKF